MRVVADIIESTLNEIESALEPHKWLSGREREWLLIKEKELKAELERVQHWLD